MATIVTFLGKGGTGRTTTAIAAARRYADQGQRVLFVTQDTSPEINTLLGLDLGVDPQPWQPNLAVVQLRSATLLERSWAEVKELEAQYVRTPFFKAVYGEELGVLPGMDAALALNTLRVYEASGSYDVIVYDGTGDQSTLRMFGLPEVLTWYTRRFRQVFTESDLGKAISPFIQPISSTVLTVDWSSGDLFNNREANQVTNQLEAGRLAVQDPTRVVGYLVTTPAAGAIAKAKYFWGSAQQIGLTIGGVLVTPGSGSAVAADAFAPLTITSLPTAEPPQWDALMAAIPDLTAAYQAPKSMDVDVAAQQVKLFLPGFDKQQVKLTQYGPDVTIEAGDQRRNLLLPPALVGKDIQGARFQAPYLVITFG